VKQIIADKLHILVFPEIGMDAPQCKYGFGVSLRCNVLPGTSGCLVYPLIDYYLSSELMEPENAYTLPEKPILLTNLWRFYSLAFTRLK